MSREETSMAMQTAQQAKKSQKIRTRVFATRLSESEAAAVIAVAERESLSVSNFIRSKLFPEKTKRSSFYQAINSLEQ